jgi:hypothetical protein
VDLKRFKHDTIRVTGVANTNTLAGGAAGPLPARMVFAVWDPDTASEHCTAKVTATGTVTFYTSGATNYDGYLHVWSVV